MSFLHLADNRCLQLDTIASIIVHENVNIDILPGMLPIVMFDAHDDRRIERHEDCYIECENGIETLARLLENAGFLRCSHYKEGVYKVFLRISKMRSVSDIENLGEGIVSFRANGGSQLYSREDANEFALLFTAKQRIKRRLFD